MSTRIVDVIARDIRFPTSRALDGSDAMHPDPDYSAAYVVLLTDRADGLSGHGLTFTCGRGTELCVAAAHSLAPLVRGRTLEEITGNMAAFWRSLTSDGQLRWVGPEKGVLHLATAAVVNAVWDLWAKIEGKPLWKLVVDMAPEELVRCIDFRYITDVITPQEAVELLRQMAPGKAQREAELMKSGYPAYTTSTGWLGYSDEKIRALCREALAEGWRHFKIKVGRDLQDDIRRCSLVREEIGPDNFLMVDANQVWDVPTAIEWVKHLQRFDLWWMEEPTSPDDVLGHATIARAIAPVKVATGEMCQNRVIFKQLMQAEAIHFCQIDSCRLGGVNEVLAVYLMAAKLGVRVCPHAGGVGLCEYVQHLQMIDYLAISGTMEDRVVEYVDHLHEHFLDPVVVINGHYMPPQLPGYSIEMRPESLDRYEFPAGEAWRSRTHARRHVNAPRADVYRALLDADAVATWMVPSGMTSHVHAFDAREGGLFRISLTYDAPTGTGKTSAHTDTYHGRFVKLVPNELVIEEMEFETDDPAMRGVMTVTYTLNAADGGTELVAVHDNVPPGVSPADNKTGWRMSLDKLAALVEAGENP